MSTQITSILQRAPRALVLLVLLSLLVSVVAVVASSGGSHTVSAVFGRALNVHEGDEVRILGVPVGKIEKVEPKADEVVVTMSYGSEYDLAVDATAAVVTPTLVSVRYVQLGPLAQSPDDGVLPDGATIDRKHTATPLEWDDIKNEVDQLVQVLGPQDPGDTGSLSRLLTTSSRNLKGTSADMRATLSGLAEAFDTLARGRQDLFSTIRNLATLVEALAANDEQVALFNSRLAEVSGVLASNKDNLAELLRTLDASTAEIEAFLRNNRDALKHTVLDLRSIVSNLARSRQALADVLQRAPTAVSNLHNIYDPYSGALTTVAAATNLNDPAQFLCATVMAGAPEGPDSTQATRMCDNVLSPLLDTAAVSSPPATANPNERRPNVRKD